ncbi:MAG: tyrosine-protein phosphatase [Phycisphaerales bacterium]|nr:tyrosine-protein phosphatase [Phycisphaerales bacterium]
MAAASEAPRENGTAPSAATTPAEPSPLTVLDNFHAIEAGRAYRCAQVREATLPWVVRTHGIRTVVNLRGPNPGTDWYDREVRICDELGVRRIDIRMSASSLPTPENLLLLYDTIRTAEEPLLFHCKSGADRTGMAAAAWRRIQLGEDAATAGRQLSMRFGHFRNVHPEMFELIRMMTPTREWIEQEYPRALTERTAAQGERGNRRSDEDD